MGRSGFGYHADLQPAVGGCEEERGDVVGVGELQQPLPEPGLVPAGTRRQVWVFNRASAWRAEDEQSGWSITGGL